MRRRQFFTVIASALLSASAQAQQAGALRRVDVLFPGLLGEERERLITEVHQWRTRDGKSKPRHQVRGRRQPIAFQIRQRICG